MFTKSLPSKAFFGERCLLRLSHCVVIPTLCGCGVANTLLPFDTPYPVPSRPLGDIDRWEVGGVEVTDPGDAKKLRGVCDVRFWTPEVGTSPGYTLAIFGYRDDERIVTRVVFGDRLLRGGYNDLTYAELSPDDAEWLYEIAGTTPDRMGPAVQ